MTGWALGDTTANTDADTGNATEPTAVVVGFGNYVWVDENRNGRQDPDEPPLAGVVVWLLDASGTPILARSGQPITAVTDASGFYFIDDLQPGAYRARFVLPSGCVFTITGGGTGHSDSNPDPRTGMTPVWCGWPACRER